ncbi:Carbohydrate ABC transporter permease OS=Streptomyces alboniger OX=132473 GN=CP975_27895 PE=3 SV=1 [Streptomyces alboniger]
MNPARTHRSHRVLLHLAALAVALVILAPFAWMAIASISQPSDLSARPYDWWPDHPSLFRYSDIFQGKGDDVAGAFRQSILNSLIVAGGTVAISMAVGVLGAYAFAMLRFRGRRLVLMVFLGTYMLPPIALLITLYLLMSSLGLLDTRLGLILVYCSYVTPFVLWIMSNFFLTVPPELEEAARIDGCSRMGALVRVILPVARPGLFATLMFASAGLGRVPTP